MGPKVSNAFPLSHCPLDLSNWYSLSLTSLTMQKPKMWSSDLSSDTFFACFPIITPNSTSQSDFEEFFGKQTSSCGPQIELLALKNTIGSFGALASVSFACAE